MKQTSTFSDRLELRTNFYFFTRLVLIVIRLNSFENRLKNRFIKYFIKFIVNIIEPYVFIMATKFLDKYEMIQEIDDQ